MIKYWNEDYYFSYLHWNEEKEKKKHACGWVSSCTGAAGQKGAVSLRPVEPGFGDAYGWFGGGSCVSYCTWQLCRWKDAPSVGVSPRPSVLGIMLWELVLLSKGSCPSKCREGMISQKTQFPTTGLCTCIPLEAHAGSKCTRRWINTVLFCCCCGRLSRSRRG